METTPPGIASLPGRREADRLSGPRARPCGLWEGAVRIVPLLIPLLAPACASFPGVSGPPPTFAPPREVAAAPAAVVRLRFTPDGGRIAAGGADNVVRIYRAETWELERAVEIASGQPVDVGWDAAGERLAAVTKEGIHVYEFPEGNEVLSVRMARRGAPGVEAPAFLWSPGGGRLAVSGFDNASVRVYSGGRLEDEIVLTGHYGPVSAMEWGRDDRLFTASWDGTVRRWDATAGTGSFLTPNLGRGRIRLARLDAIGALATVAYGDRDVLVWNMETGKRTTRVVGSAPVGLIRVSPDSRTAALADTGGAVWIRDVPAWNVERLLAGEGTVEELQWSRDGRFLAGMAAGDGAVRVWDVATGGVARLQPPAAEAIAMAWSPDGRRLITGSRSGKIFEWVIAR